MDEIGMNAYHSSSKLRSLLRSLIQLLRDVCVKRVGANHSSEAALWRD